MIHSCVHEARARKATKLADALRLLNCDCEVAAYLSEEGWERLAAFAEVRPPSWQTRAMVLDLLREREERAQRFEALMERLPGVGA
jgi:ribonuclease D